MSLCRSCTNKISKNKHASKLGKCDACYFCRYEGCNKTSIINNYCRLHVSCGREKRKPCLGTHVTESDITRRERHADIDRIRDENFLKMRNEIQDYKIQTSYTTDRMEIARLDNMIAEYNLAVEVENERIQREIDEFLEWANRNIPRTNFRLKNGSRKSWKRSSHKEDPEAEYERTGSSYEEESDSEAEYENKFNKYDAALTLLGLTITCRDLNEIKRAYWSKAKEYHPDKHPGEETIYNALFQDISNAYQLLADR